MSIWAEIKHALNSTLGKSYFQSVDKLFFRTKTLVASENVFFDFGADGSASVYGAQQYNVSKKIRFFHGGNAIFRVYCNVGTAGDLKTSDFVVLKNDVEIARSTTKSDKMLEATVKIDPYDVISFRYVNNRTSTSIFDNLVVCADLVDAGFEVI